jgi:hypothetical protein
MKVRLRKCVVQAFQPDSVIVRLESLTYGKKSSPRHNWSRRDRFEVASFDLADFSP